MVTRQNRILAIDLINVLCLCRQVNNSIDFSGENLTAINLTIALTRKKMDQSFFSFVFFVLEEIKKNKFRHV